MTAHFHAIVWIDHAEARIFHIGLTGDDEIVLHPHLPTRHLHHKAGSIGSGHAAPDKEFLAQVMEAVSDAGEILVIGPSNAKTELASYSAITIQRSALGSPAWKPPTIRATARSSPMPGSTFESRSRAPARPARWRTLDLPGGRLGQVYCAPDSRRIVAW